MKKGYTLIELVVVVGILVVISSLVTGILYTTLRSTTKTTVTTNVSQNGSYALSTITNIITSSSEVLDVYNGEPGDFSDCTDSPQGSSIELQRLDGGITTLACTDDTIASKSAEGSFNLLNTEAVQTTANCSFTCKQSTVYDTPVIEINFSLIDKSTSSFKEDQASADFNTSVVLRNYQAPQ
jgi:prepilin-type N-terminal cleavage/methylation domain-containing protein